MSGGPERAPGAAPDLARVLLELSRPWIAELGPAPPRTAVAFVVQAAGLAWNTSRVENAELRAVMRARATRVLQALAPAAGTEIETLLGGLVTACEALYPEDRRMVASVELEDLGADGYQIVVGRTE